MHLLGHIANFVVSKASFDNQAMSFKITVPSH